MSMEKTYQCVVKNIPKGMAVVIGDILAEFYNKERLFSIEDKCTLYVRKSNTLITYSEHSHCNSEEDAVLVIDCEEIMKELS